MKNKINKKIIANILLISVGIFTLGFISPTHVEDPFSDEMKNHITMENMPEHRETLLAQKDAMIKEMIAHEGYQCCLKKPCATCLELTPWHGEGAACSCLEDLVNGKAPCGECVGGILAGRGNPYLAEYFAVAIADGVGVEYTDTLREIIKNKYGTPVTAQL